MKHNSQLHQSQHLQLNSWQIQCSQILQMDSASLEAYLRDLAMENPLIELEPADPQAPAETPVSWASNSAVSSGASGLPEIASDAFSPSLITYVLHQIDTSLHGRDRMLVRFLAGYLDDNGYLSPDFETICRESPYSTGELLRAKALLQDLEPSGIGASDLTECLLLQLPENAQLERLLVRDYLQQIAYSEAGLAKELGISQAHLDHAIQVIRSLNPKPGRNISPTVQAEYILPDYVIQITENDTLSACATFQRPLRLCPDYAVMLSGTGDAELTDYLAQKQKEFLAVSKALENRYQLLDHLIDVLLDTQKRFFRLGPVGLQPFRMKDAANLLGVHESTISRAVCGKYLSCSLGTFPLKYFFVRSVGNEIRISTHEATEALRTLIASEPSGKAYSDQALAELLQKQGICLARRTVTKYRESMNIPSFSVRRKQQRLQNQGGIQYEF